MYDYQTANPLYYDLLKGFAKENRKFQTDAEKYLWECLRERQLGVRFKRQHIIDVYIADFACIEKRLIIEVDGGYHSQEQQIKWDEQRTERINELGYKVIRFRNEEIIANINNVISIIKDNL